MSEAEAVVNQIVKKYAEKLDSIKNTADSLTKRAIQDLAVELEGKLPLETIAKEIVDRLEGRVSKTVVYESLEDKYKRRTKPKKIPQAESAIDEQKQRAVLPQQNTESAEPQLGSQPLSKLEMKAAVGGESVVDLDHRDKIPSQDDNLVLVRNLPASDLQDQLFKANQTIETLTEELAYEREARTEAQKQFVFTYSVFVKGKEFPLIVTSDPKSKKGIVEINEKEFSI